MNYESRIKCVLYNIPRLSYTKALAWEVVSGNPFPETLSYHAAHPSRASGWRRGALADWYNLGLFIVPNGEL
jgi:hypothetical protein